MAEKKVIVFICDRDGFEHKRLRGHKLPAGWLTIQGKDLCPKCVGQLDLFLEGAQVLESDPVVAAPLIPNGEGVRI